MITFSASFLNRFPYAWLPGFDQPLEDLLNVAYDLYPYTRPLRFPPTTPPLDALPIRESALDDGMATQGKPTSGFRFGFLPLPAFQYLMTTYWTVSGERVAYREMTVYTEDVELGVFTRFNAHVFRPVPDRDYKRNGSVVEQLIIPMLLLEVLAEP